MTNRLRWLPSGGKAFAFLWVVLAAFVVVRATNRPDSRSVLLDHLEFGRRLALGEDVYGPWKSDPDAPIKPLHAPYPPSFGLLTAPFAGIDALLGLKPTRAAWALVQVLAFVALFRVLRRMPRGLAPPTENEHRIVFLLCLVLLARLLLRDTHGGGGNLINVAMCALAFVHAENGAHVRAGWWLGFSLATKPTQALLLPVLWCQGHRRTVLHALVAGACFAGLSLGLLRFDLAPWLRWFEGSLAIGAQVDAFAAPALQWPEFEWMNQSLRMAVARWFGTVPGEFASRVAWGVTPGLGLSPTACAWITRGVLTALLLPLFASAWRSQQRTHADESLRSEDRGAQRTWQFAAALALSLLASPLTWKGHHVALLPLAYALLLDARRSRSVARWLHLAAWFVCCGIGKEIVGDDGDEWLNSTYVMVLFDVVWIALALRLSAPRDRV